MKTKTDIHNKRDQNKINLETYFHNKTNIFDIAIDKLINELKTLISTSKTQFENLGKLHQTDSTHYAELIELPENDELNFNNQFCQKFLDNIHNEEQLLSLVEMKIIYSFKSLEISIKKLLGTAFKLETTQVKEFYKWDSILKFLKDRNIDAMNLKSYSEIKQLKDVNNAIKHSKNYENSFKLNTIEEFKKSDEFTYAKIDNFYNRIKDIPNIFLQELSLEIYKSF